MGVRRTVTVYVSDRNEEYELSEMQFSHLLNAHRHHTKQLLTMEFIKANTDQLPLSRVFMDRYDNLQETLKVLEMEIRYRTREAEEDVENGRSGTTTGRARGYGRGNY